MKWWQLYLVTTALLTASVGQASQGDLVCQWETKTFSIRMNQSGAYDVSLSDTNEDSSFSIEALRKRFPGADDQLLQTLSKTMNGALGDDISICKGMQTCQFSPVGQPELAQCQGAPSKDATPVMTIELRGGTHYKINCGIKKESRKSVAGLSYQQTYTENSTLMVSIPAESCRYQ